MDLSVSTLTALFVGITALIICAGGIWLSWYYETYNEDFFAARKRGTLFKRRNSGQHPLHPGW